MKAEIVAVGTELLMGQIVNTNAQYLSERFAGLGIDVYFQTVVGDNPGRIRQTLEIAKSRADLIVLTGGLGPTQDDLTKHIVADFTGRELHTDAASMQRIEAFFKQRGIVMVESNARQAMLIDGSTILPNETGLAIGNALTDGGTHYLLLPGPPKELKPMFEMYAEPWLQSVMGEETPLYSKMLKFAGIGESTLEDRLLDLIERQTDPTLAPYAKEGEVAVRVTTRARTAEEAEAKMAPLVEEIRRRAGTYLYAEKDVGLEQAVVERLIRSGLTLAAAESCTGGLVSDLITAIPGSSAAFRGAVVSYTNALKHGLLNVPLELLEGAGAPGAVSRETAVAMADGLLQATDADYALSITGVAGPSESEGKPVGLVYIGLARRGYAAEAFESRLSGNREMIKLRASKAAIYRLWVKLAAETVD